MKYNLPFRTVLKKTNEVENVESLPFELDYDKRFHFIKQKEDKDVDEAMEKAYQKGVDPTVNIGEGEFGGDIAKGFIELIEKIVDKKKVKRILDVGCGTGFFVHKLREMGFDCVGVEPGRSLCDIAKERYGIDILCGYLDSFQFEEKFDMVYAHGVLDHVREPEKLIKQMTERLKPGGLLLCSTPNQKIPLAVGDPSLMVHQHRSYFTPGSAERLLNLLGLWDVKTKESTRYAFYLYFWGVYGGSLFRSSILPEKSEKMEDIIMTYNTKVNIFLDYLQHRINKAMAEKKSIGLYGAITYPFGLLRWYGQKPRIFDTDKAKHGYYLQCNPNPIENPENLKTLTVDEIWIQAYKYDQQIRDMLTGLGVKAKIVSYKKLFEEGRQ